MTTNNLGLDKLGEHMAVKKYLYREDQSVFDKIEATKQKYAEQKFTTKDAITFLINAGYQVDNPTTPAPEVPMEIGLLRKAGVEINDAGELTLPSPAEEPKE